MKRSLKECSKDMLCLTKQNQDDIIVALAGSPNVGKSTVFNALTGSHRHTGNWAGKTVSCAACSTRYAGRNLTFIDIPGCYSLVSHSVEEEVARDCICFGQYDVAVVVCDATCIERNIGLVLQILETGRKCVVCVNLIDSAKENGTEVDVKKLGEMLGVRAVAVDARSRRGLDGLLLAVKLCADSPVGDAVRRVRYPNTVTDGARQLSEMLGEYKMPVSPEWLAMRILDGDSSVITAAKEHRAVPPDFSYFLSDCRCKGLDRVENAQEIPDCISAEAKRICSTCVKRSRVAKGFNRDRKIDNILTGKYTAYPVMLIMLAVILWLTIKGANYPSALLGKFLFFLEDKMALALYSAGAPEMFISFLIHGVYRVVAWIVSVMLPPMAIFFPLFTLLEDLGFLPRVAFNLDRAFKSCRACGKQALTMCMGFGCNAAGVTGCRIIDSPRERLVAILTNSLVPCNGRFPLLFTLISLIFILSAGSDSSSLAGAAVLSAAVVVSVLISLVSSKLLTATVLKGEPSSFALELPPYRKPLVMKVITRSIFDRTLFVLGRAVCVAIPAGAVIWLCANINIGGTSVLDYCTRFLDPAGRLLGLDGVILMGFILGFPANEIVLPVILMSYTASSLLGDSGSAADIAELLIQNGWTVKTVVCAVFFSLFHWPCSTTLITVKKETGRVKWTLIAFLLPTVVGAALCIAVNLIMTIFI